MKRILVTGAGGYIGTTLVPMLLGKGFAVRAVDRFFFGRELLASHPRLEVLQDDTRRLNPSVLEKVDAVIDLVALSNDPTGELFEQSTWDINHTSRVRTATLAKNAGVRRYILPSSCSIYGWQSPDVRVTEDSATNPLTTYAKANECAERDILEMADETFCAVVLRQATVYGLSPRMRFDLAINGMTIGAWKTGALPLMRDGSQWRPMVHVKDTAAAQCFVLEAEPSLVNGQIFNVGSDRNNYQLGPLAERVVQALPREVRIEWYGDPDHRSYRVSFDKIEKLGFRAQYVAEDGAREIYDALESGRVEPSPRMITLEWYRQLSEWHAIVKQVEMYGGILDIEGELRLPPATPKPAATSK